MTSRTLPETAAAFSDGYAFPFDCIVASFQERKPLHFSRRLLQSTASFLAMALARHVDADDLIAKSKDHPIHRHSGKR